MRWPRHQPLEATFACIYGRKFVSFAVPEEKFRASGTKDFGSTLQQATGD
jgi:hypothetical protein